MNGHDRGNPSVVLAKVSEIIQVNRDQSCLPVMAVDQIRAETDHRKNAQSGFREKCELLDIPLRISVIGRKSAEIMFVVNEVERNIIQNRFKNAYILVLSGNIHIKVSNVFQFFFPFLLHACVIGQHDTHIVFLFVELFGERTHNICKTARLDKRHTF